VQGRSGKAKAKPPLRHLLGHLPVTTVRMKVLMTKTTSPLYELIKLEILPLN
jgi:hypothetical protein